MTLIRKQIQARLGLVALTLSAGLLPSVAQADAIGQAILHVKNFKITQVGSFTSGTVSANGSVTAQLDANAITAVNSALTNFSITAAQGAGYIADSPLTGPTTAVPSFAGSEGLIAGSSFTPAGAESKTDSTVSISGSGSGKATSSTGTDFGWIFDVGSGGGSLGFNFDADQWLRAYLSGTPIIGGTARAKTNWSLTISKEGGGQVFNWTPDGAIGTIVGGTETLDPIDLSTEVSASPNFQDNFIDNRTPSFGAFAATTNLLTEGRYQLSISHGAEGLANIEVPEPGSLALVGLALLGLGAASRRQRSMAA
jgi:hypothetical protein